MPKYKIGELGGKDLNVTTFDEQEQPPACSTCTLPPSKVVKALQSMYTQRVVVCLDCLHRAKAFLTPYTKRRLLKKPVKKRPRRR